MSLLSVHQEVDRRALDALRGHLGPLVCARLEDPEVTDVLLNPDGTLFEDRKRLGMSPFGFMTEHDAVSAINWVASAFGGTVDRGNPVFEGELPIRGARWIAFVPPITAKPAFAIRIPSPVIFTLADYVAARIMTAQQAEVLEGAIGREWNILVAGGTKAGKTALLNALFDALRRTYPNKRVCLIEEIIELQCVMANVLALRTGPGADQQDLLMRLMRTRPDVIAIGEVRDKAALVLVKAANTGHGSVLSTIHANSARRAPLRMEDLCAEALPAVNMRKQIADALGIVVSISRSDPADLEGGEPERRINEILKVEGVENGEYVFTQLA